MGKPHLPLAVKLAAKVLVKSGHSAREVAKDLGVSNNSVSAWNKDPKYEILRSEEVSQIKQSLAGNSYKIAHRIQSGISDAKIEAANLSQLAVSQAIFIDKARLLEGLSTSNLSIGGVLQNVDAELSKISEKMALFDAQSSEATDSQ